MNKKSFSFSVNQILFIILFLETLVITIAIAISLSLNISPQTYFNEVDNNGYLTYFSFLQLLITAFLSLKIFNIHKHITQLRRLGVFWLIICIGLFYLALDDLIGIHEQVDLWIHDIFMIQETMFSDLIDDLIVGIYLCISLVYIASKWQIIKLYQHSFVFFKIGFVFSAVMIFLDVISNNALFISMVTNNPQTILLTQQWIGVIEDSVKLFAEGMFIVGLYSIYRFKKAD